MTRRMLAAQGLRVVEVDLVTDIEIARTQISKSPGCSAIRRAAKSWSQSSMRRGRGSLRGRTTPFETALVVERGGYTQGPRASRRLCSGSRAAAAAGAPAGYGGFIPLEKLLLLKPDIVC